MLARHPILVLLRTSLGVVIFIVVTFIVIFVIIIVVVVTIANLEAIIILEVRQRLDLRLEANLLKILLQFLFKVSIRCKGTESSNIPLP